MLANTAGNGDEQQGGPAVGSKPKATPPGRWRSRQHGDEEVGAHHPDSGERYVLIVPESSCHRSSAQPMPMESLKKASPMAVSTTPAVTLEKSGENRKFSPRSPWQGQTANADHQQQDEENRHQPLGDGLIPSGHPYQQYASHQASTSHCHSRLCKGSVMSELKAAPVTAGSVERIRRWPP